MEAAFRKEGAASLNRNQEVVGGIGCRRVCRFHVSTGTKRWGEGLGAGGFVGFMCVQEPRGRGGNGCRKVCRFRVGS